MTDFRKIVFGKTDARAESAECPNLAIDGYFPVDNIDEKILELNPFLILGSKGSGKTALSEFLKLTADGDTIVDQLFLKEFPYKIYGRIVSENSDPEVQYKLAWRWILLVHVLQNLIADKDARPSTKKDLRKATEFLAQSGLMEIITLSDLVKMKSSFSVKAFSMEHTTSEETASVSLDLIVNYVKDLVVGFKETHRHILVVDGIDSFLFSPVKHYPSLVALIDEAKDLNLFFREKDLPAKIILLCRTDLFEQLPDPNKNKIRRDYAYLLDWYEKDVSGENRLITIANMRTRLVYPEVEDMFSEFFPSGSAGDDIRSELLGYTRHTPRDFMQLLVSIQQNCPESKVSEKAIERGLADYSTDYFIPEIRDEMAGYLPFDDIDRVMGVLSSFRSREFSSSAFDQALRESALTSGLSSTDILKVLFDCGAIGCIHPSGDGSQPGVVFKYQDRHSAVSQSDRFLLHNGLCKGLNVIH